MKKRPKVWYVDDLPSNLNDFVNAHKDNFDVETFNEIDQVIERLETDTPDAILCDIFFYDTLEEAENIEQKINFQKEKLRENAHDIGADDVKNQAGIDLIERLSKINLRIPIYAYTSKGPYLLESRAFDRIAEAKAKLLLKNQYSRQVERTIIREDILQFQRGKTLYAKLSRYKVPFVLMNGVVGWIIGKLLESFVG